MTHPAFDGLNLEILSKSETCFSTSYDFYLLGSTSKLLQSSFNEVVDSKPLNFFTIMADSDEEPRTTLQSQAEGLQCLMDKISLKKSVLSINADQWISLTIGLLYVQKI